MEHRSISTTGKTQIWWRSHNCPTTSISRDPRQPDCADKIQIPAPKVDLTPVIAAINKLADVKPKEWKFRIKRNAVGGISEVVATAE